MHIMQQCSAVRCTVGSRQLPCTRPIPLSAMARWQPCRHSRVLVKAEKDSGSDPGGDLDMESLFAKEVQKRGLDSMDAGDLGSRGSTGGPSDSTSTSKSPFQSATKTKQADTNTGGDQRQRSIALVNEGLEGLIPRASELLKLGASVFLAFVPLIVAISLMFGGIYYVFGDHFVHGGDRSYGRQTYYDPAELLSEPTADPYIPYQ